MNEIYTLPFSCQLTDTVSGDIRHSTFASIHLLRYCTKIRRHFGYKTFAYKNVRVVAQLSLRALRSIKLVPPFDVIFSDVNWQKRKEIIIIIIKKKKRGLFQYSCETAQHARGKQQMAKHPRRLRHTVTVWRNRMEAAAASYSSLAKPSLLKLGGGDSIAV